MPCHRLMAICQINDGQPRVCQSAMLCQQAVILIRAAVMQAFFHMIQNMQKIIPLPQKLGGGVVKAGNTTHSNLPHEIHRIYAILYEKGRGFIHLLRDKPFLGLMDTKKGENNKKLQKTTEKSVFFPNNAV